MKNSQEENYLEKEAIGLLGIAGIGAGVGLLAYGLEKSFDLLSGNKSVTEAIAGFNVDKQKVADFERDLQQVIEMAPKLRMISEAMDQAVTAYIEACQQALPQMKAQIAAAEKKVDAAKRSKEGKSSVPSAPLSGGKINSSSEEPGKSSTI